jgi:phosphoadenosine phosphosulfate reductase
MDMINEQLQKKIDRAIRLLQGVQNGYDGEIEVAYSGGKDSDVILQLAKESGIRYRAIHKSTTIDPPGTIAHVKEMGVEILRPKISFFNLVAKKGLPSRFYRFCCEQLKEYKVCNKAIIGVRKAESSKRAAIYKEPTECRYYGEKKEENHVEAIYPILEWTDEDVRNFIIDRKLKLAPIYYNSGGANRRIETPGLYVLPTRLTAQAYRVLQGETAHGSLLSARRQAVLGHTSRLTRSRPICRHLRMVYS